MDKYKYFIQICQTLKWIETENCNQSPDDISPR